MRRVIGRLSGLLIATMLVIAALLSIPTKAAAATGTICKDQTFTGAAIVGNLIVPSGAFCDLYETTVSGNATVDPRGGLLTDRSSTIKGNVTVQVDGQFAGFGGSTVGGSIACNGCKVADLQSSTVHGDLLDIGVTKGAFIRNDTIGGKLEIVSSQGGRFGYQIQSNLIGSTFRFDNNHGASNISNNSISGALECSGNKPRPTGSGNVAVGGKQGQCAAL
jgi:hypothetical protein